MYLSTIQIVLYALIATQMASWAWFSWKGGKLSNNKFYLFSGGMMLGQVATCFETYTFKAWGTLSIQVFLFAFTLFGAIMRYREAKRTR